MLNQWKILKFDDGVLQVDIKGSNFYRIFFIAYITRISRAIEKKNYRLFLEHPNIYIHINGHCAAHSIYKLYSV